MKRNRSVPLIIKEGLGEVLLEKGSSISILKKGGLNGYDETIRLFNLNGSLRRIRQTMVIGYLQTAEELAEIALEFGQEEYKLLLDEEIDKINDLPFSTAIKHILIT